MAMKSRTDKRVQLQVSDLTGNMSAPSLKIKVELLEIDSGGHESGFGNDSGWGVRLGDLSISCNDEAHARNTFIKCISMACALNTGMIYDRSQIG